LEANPNPPEPQQITSSIEPTISASVEPEQPENMLVAESEEEDSEDRNTQKRDEGSEDKSDPELPLSYRLAAPTLPREHNLQKKAKQK